MDNSLFSPFSLTGKTILITGANSGIGQQCAVDCSKMGARVVLIARNKERLLETLDLMEGEGHQYFIYDLTDIDGIGSFISIIAKEVGKFDGFIHAAGIEITKPFRITTPTDFDILYKVNFVSGIEIVRFLSSAHSFNNGGSIVFIASITATIGRRGLAAYSASKGAIVSAVRPIALELANRNIRVNSISPGTIMTPMIIDYLNTLDEDSYKKRVDGFPLGLGQTTDISLACVYLLSSASKWITGQNIIIDGGFTCH